MQTYWLFTFALLFTATARPVGKSQRTPGHKFEIVSVGMKVEDLGADTDSYMIHWKVVVENELTVARKPYGKIKYLDSDGYEVDGDMFGGCVAAGKRETFTGETLVSSQEEKQIVTAKGEVLDDFRCDYGCGVTDAISR